jgi:hypothetical protein
VYKRLNSRRDVVGQRKKNGSQKDGKEEQFNVIFAGE